MDLDKKYHPTPDELKVINDKFAKEPFQSAEDLYVFPALIVDNQMTAYFTRLHPDFLKQCVKDCINGVVFLVGHNKEKLPMAKTFKGKSVTTGVDENKVIEVFAKFFMQKDLKVNELNTDDFMKGYLGGTLEDVSIGFAANRYECSICKFDIRDYENCKHYPGLRYNKDDEKVKKGGTLCFAWVMEPAGPSGEALLEISACYKGAVPNAKLKDPKDVPKFTINLMEGKNLKEMALDTPIAVNFSFPISSKQAEFNLDRFLAGEYSEEDLKAIKLSPENVDAILAKELSEAATKKLKDFAIENKADLANYLKIFPAPELLHSEKEFPRLTRVYANNLPDDAFAVTETVADKKTRYFLHHNDKGDLAPLHLKAALASLSDIKNEDIRSKATAHLEKHKRDLEITARDVQQTKEIKDLKATIEAANVNNNVAIDKIKKLETENKDLATKLKSTEEANLTLQKEKTALESKAKEGDEYRVDLIKEILVLGVKINGNEFDKEALESALKEMSLKDIKKMKAQFWTQLCDKLPAVKQALGPEVSLSVTEQKEEIPDEAFKV